MDLCLDSFFFFSQMLCFLSLKRGDASLMTPIMGSKPIFVALFVTTLSLTPNNLTPSIWIAVALATLSIALIGWPSTKADFSPHGILLAVIGAAGFGLLDSLVPFFTNQSDPFFSYLLYLVLLVYFQFCLSRGRKGPLFATEKHQICGCGYQPSLWGARLYACPWRSVSIKYLRKRISFMQGGDFGLSF